MKRYFTIEETKKEEVFKMKILKEYYPELSLDFALPQPILDKWAEWAKQWMPWVTYDLILSSTAWGHGQSVGFCGVPLTVVSEVQAMFDAMDGKLNGYVSFYNGKQRDCWTETKAQAHELAVKYFQGLNPRKKVKSYDITTMPAFINGKAYINDTSF